VDITTGVSFYKGLYEPFAGNGDYGTLYPKVRYNRVCYNEIIQYLEQNFLTESHFLFVVVLNLSDKENTEFQRYFVRTFKQ